MEPQVICFTFGQGHEAEAVVGDAYTFVTVDEQSAIFYRVSDARVVDRITAVKIDPAVYCCDRPRIPAEEN